MTDYERELSRRGPMLAEKEKELKDAGVRFVQVQIIDANGALRTKIAPFKLSAGGEAVNCNFLCTAPAEGAPLDEPLFAAAVSSDANGFPNMRGLADPETVRQHAWRPEWASVLVDTFEIEGARNRLDPRALVARHEAHAKDMGFEPLFALEYEFGIFHADEELLAQRRYRDLKPWGSGLINYSTTRSPAFTGLFADLIDRLAAIGVGVAGAMSEYGHGMYEMALAPARPLAAADGAVRAKNILQELCRERGLIATFMARFQPPGRESASGAHHHQSLWKGGRNVFAGENGTLSETGRHYLAGLLDHMAETHLVFRPNINSYRRFDAGAWSPTCNDWGPEFRTRAVRAITIPDEAAARLEHRVPGADVHPYLTVAAMLAAGLDGIERRLEPDTVPLAHLPGTLEASLEAFSESAFAADVFGVEIREHYATSRRFELAAFERWMSSHITDFEWQRYFPTT